MTPQDYEYLQKLLKARSGLVLSSEKHYLVESRLLPVARRNGLFNLTGLVAEASRPGCRAADRRGGRGHDDEQVVLLPRQAAVRAFPRRHHAGAAVGAHREPAHPHLVRGRRHRPGALFARHRIEGDGQGLRGFRIEIVATDLSTEVLEKARSGIYSQFEVQRGLPALMLIKYFSQVGEAWQIAPEIRGMVKFMPLNLLNDFSHLGRFDLVLCRNVLIYFDQANQDCRTRTHRRRHRARRLPGAGRRRDRGRADRPFQADPRQARRLRAARRHADSNVLSFNARPAVPTAAGAGR